MIFERLTLAAAKLDTSAIYYGGDGNVIRLSKVHCPLPDTISTNKVNCALTAEQL